MSHPAMTGLVSALPARVPFVGPEHLERARGARFNARLGANENGFGPSPRAVAAMASAAADCWQYGDPENYALKQALADYHRVAPANIVVGEGIDGLLGYLARMYVEPGVRVVTSDGAYPTFNYHILGNGGDLQMVPYRDDAEDIDALLAAGVGARLIYLANPDNPMGTEHGPEEMARMMSSVPEGALLVLDEAYGDFSEAGLLPIDTERANVIRFRTFSKLHGMAGARVGYGIGHGQVIAAFDRIRNHFGMSRVSVAGAMAALADTDNAARVRDAVRRARMRISDIAAANGLTALPSAANFVAIDCGRDGDFARAVLAALADLGVFVRMPFVAPQDRCIRVSAGPDVALQKFAEALPAALALADQRP